MKNIKFYFALILMICSFNNSNAQEYPEANKENIIDLQTEEYYIILGRYSDGNQNLSWEEGEKLFGMGGSLQEILERLFDEYEWKVAQKWMRDNYHLRINYNLGMRSKQEVNQIFLGKLSEALGANIKKSRIQKQAICVDWAASNGEGALQKAQNKNVMNQIMKRANLLQINSVKLYELDRLVSLNSDFNLKMKNVEGGSNRFDFNFDIKNKNSFIESLNQYGFQVDECEEDRILVSLY